MRKEPMKQPIKMGKEIFGNSVMEKYLGDIIHEKGCEESITATIKERMRKLTSKCEEIIQIATELKKWGARRACFRNTHGFSQEHMRQAPIKKVL